MSIIRTNKSKPRGNPIWSSFINREDVVSLENESMSASFLQLANKLAEVVQDYSEDGKIVDVTMNNRTHSLFFPHPEDEFQIAFVIVFEENDKILIDKTDRESLIRDIVEGLRKYDAFRKQLEKADPIIARNDSLYKGVINMISKIIIKWDSKRVKYLANELKKQREDAMKIIKDILKQDETK